MATSSRQVQVIFSSGVVASNTIAAANNTLSPAQIQIIELAPGANTITPPGAGSSPQGCMIVPPAANTNSITLKGVTGDQGVPLHLTDPTSLALGSTTGTFVLTAVTTISGMRLFWS